MREDRKGRGERDKMGGKWRKGGREKREREEGEIDGRMEEGMRQREERDGER